MEGKALVGNAADSTQVRDSGKTEKDRRKRELDDVKNVLSSLSGRRFFWRLLSKCGLFRISYEVGGSRIEDSIYREGERNIGLTFLADLNESDPEAYLKMLNESKGNLYGWRSKSSS